MTIEELEVYSHDTNSGIVRLPERKFPGVVIQGDSLSILYGDLMSAVENAEGRVSEEAFLTMLESAQSVEAHLLSYESTLRSHGIQVPYDRDPNRSTLKYRHYWERKCERTGR